MNSREQEMWSAGLFLGAFALLYLYWKVFGAVVKGLYLFLRWAWRKYPGFCNGALTTVIIAAASYAATYHFFWLPFSNLFRWFEFAWWLPHAAAVTATGAYLRHKIRNYRKARQKKVVSKQFQTQIEYNAIEAHGQKIVQIRNLQRHTSPALDIELKRQGLQGVLREAKKVPWADQVILATEVPVQSAERTSPLSEVNRLQQRPRVKSKLHFELSQPKPNRSLPPRF